MTFKGTLLFVTSQVGFKTGCSTPQVVVGGGFKDAHAYAEVVSWNDLSSRMIYEIGPQPARSLGLAEKASKASVRERSIIRN